MTIHNPLVIILLVIVFLLRRPHTEPVKGMVVAETASKMLIAISSVNYDTVKYTYTTMRGGHKMTKYGRGLKPHVTFTLTNNSGKTQVIPIPNYYYIACDYFDKYQPAGAHYDGGCKCYATDYAGTPWLLDDGKFMSVMNIATEEVDGKFMLRFKPGETKAFVVPFYHQYFPASEATFWFCGFTVTDTATHKTSDLMVEIGVTDKEVKRVSAWN